MKSCFHFLNLYPSLQLNILGLVGVSLSLCGSQQEKKIYIFTGILEHEVICPSKM